MSDDGCCCTETPLVCELNAIAAEERPRYNELRRQLGAAAVGKRELTDGIAIRISTERMGLAEIAQWISFERKCCPFFEFTLEVAANAGPVWVSLTGRAGVKEFLAQAFAK
jgi:hypothetical protein